MKPTIYTIAEEAGVSIATVSRAFNNHSRISEATKQKIFGIADALGYYPSATARNLSNSTTETIAVIMPQTSRPFFMEMIRGAESICKEKQYHLLIYTSLDVDEEDSFLSLLPSRTDGIVLCSPSSTGQYIERLYKQRFPFVIIGRAVPGMDVNSIRPDNQMGSYQLMDHLIADHKYSQIAFISGPPHQAHSNQRLAGYKQALKDHSIPLREDWIKTGNFEETSGYECTRELLSLPEPPKAIFAANDPMAIGAMAAATEMGYSLPADLAIVGFDNVSSALYLQPSLTTASVDTFVQGRMAVELLLNYISNPDTPPQEVVMPAPLLLRRSCGCP
jgi:LacI family transcriptional regulator